MDGVINQYIKTVKPAHSRFIQPVSQASGTGCMCCFVCVCSDFLRVVSAVATSLLCVFVRPISMPTSSFRTTVLRTACRSSCWFSTSRPSSTSEDSRTRRGRRQTSTRKERRGRRADCTTEHTRQTRDSAGCECQLQRVSTRLQRLADCTCAHASDRCAHAPIVINRQVFNT